MHWIVIIDGAPREVSGIIRQPGEVWPCPWPWGETRPRHFRVATPEEIEEAAGESEAVAAAVVDTGPAGEDVASEDVDEEWEELRALPLKEARPRFAQITTIHVPGETWEELEEDWRDWREGQRLFNRIGHRIQARINAGVERVLADEGGEEEPTQPPPPTEATPKSDQLDTPKTEQLDLPTWSTLRAMVYGDAKAILVEAGIDVPGRSWDQMEEAYLDHIKEGGIDGADASTPDIEAEKELEL